MPYTIDPTKYGFADIDDLARALGTVQGEAGNQDLRGRAMVLDLAANRGSDRGFNTYNNYTDRDGNTYTGVAAQLATPSQFSTWNPKEQGAYQNANEMYNIINKIGADPTYYDRLPQSQKDQVDLNMAAVNGVLGTADLRGVSGGATFYSTGNPASYGPGRYDEHVGLGLGVAKANNPLIGGEYWYGGDPTNTQSIYDRINGFDYSGATDKLAANYDTSRQRLITNPQEPPARPSDADLGIDNRGPLDKFSDGLTEGLQGAARAIAGQYQAVLGRLPTVDELKPWTDAVGSGAMDLFDVVKGIATGSEAQQHGQQTGLDPSVFIPKQSDFGRLNVSGSVGNGYLGQGVTNLGMDTGQTLGSGPTASNVQPGVNPVIDQIYEATLGRPADAAGGQAWSQALNSGAMDLSQIQAAIQSGQEAQATGAPTNAQTYSQADTVYARDLGRTAEASIQPSIQTALSQGLNANQFEQGVYNSPEAAAYRATLAPDVAAQIRQPTTASTLGPGLSVQALDGNGQPLSPGAAEANQIYEQNLGRPAEAAVLQKYANDTAGAPDLAQLAAQVYGSSEAGTYRGGLDPTQAAQIAARNATMFGAPGATPTLGAGNAVTPLPPGFNDQAYLLANPDVAQSHTDPELHYELYGAREGRQIAPAGFTPTLGPGLSVQATDENGQSPLSPGAAEANQIYLHDLGRPAEASVLQRYANEANGSNTLSQLAAQVYGSDEASTYRSTLSPEMAAQIQPQNAQMFGAPALTPTIGAPGLTPTIDAPGLTPTIRSDFGVTAQDGSFGSPVTNLGISPSSMGTSNSIGIGQGIDAIGTPFGGVNSIGGLVANTRSDGTTVGTKSLAQTNAEFNAVAQFANAQSRQQTQNLGMAAVAPTPNIIGLSTAVVPSFYSAPRWL